MVIAVVGLGCRLPGCQTVQQFWDRVIAREHGFSTLPNHRWDQSTYAREMPAGEARRFTRGALLTDVEMDFSQLKVTPHKIDRLHRMERVAVVTMSDALQDAGIDKDSSPGPRGQIFLGASTLGPDPRTDHSGRIRRFELAAPIQDALASAIPAQAEEVDQWIETLFNQAAPPVDPDSMQATASLIAGRVSALFDFHGGHLAVDCGMASSLAVLERAVITLVTGQCDTALVCGLSPLLTPSAMLTFAHQGLLSEDVPRPFDARGDGTLLGEGSVALVLRRLQDVGAGRVYAVLEGLGHAYSTSGERATAEAATAALAAAQCPSDDVHVVESRALGVASVDQSEAQGLATAFRTAGRERPLLVTSSVPNVGFLQAAAGLVGVLKAVLAVHRQSWPAQLSAAVEPVPGLVIAQESVALTAASRVGVSDAGLGPMAYHAIFASPSRAVRVPRPRAQPRGAGIAIVGAGLMVPQADELDVFWRHVVEHTDAISDLPTDRFDIDKLIGGSPDVGAILTTRLAGVVTIPDYDPARFGLTAASARQTDPAVIMSLLTTERALRHAGYQAGAWDGERVSVVFGQLPMRAKEMEAEARVLFAGRLLLTAFAMGELGIAGADIDRVIEQASLIYNRTNPALGPATLHSRTGLGCAARVAQAWQFKGGVLSVDAACASSLAAVHVAMDALSLGDSDVVVAGGVAYNLLPEYYISLSMLGVLSPRGAPPFDVRSDGFVPAEGAGVVILKRYQDALDAGDKIFGVIKGIGTASDGAGTSVFGPNGLGYRRAIERALTSADVAAATVDYVEAHGGGTRRADDAELAAYGAVYGDRDAASPLVVGAIKSQIGHMSSAAGMIGLIKTAIALQNKVLPPSNTNADPELRLGRALELASEARPWVSRGGRPRRAGVSAFGLGGVNYHVILEEAVAQAGVGAADSHPARLPSQGARADRFVVEPMPISLPARPTRFRFGGKHIVLVGLAGPLLSTLQVRLQQRGARVSVLDSTSMSSAAVAQQRMEALAPVDGLLDLSTFSSGDALPPMAALREMLVSSQQRTFGLLRAVYERFSSAEPYACCYAAITGMGGDLGLTGCASAGVLGAGLVGWAKGLKQEVPTLNAKAIDFDPQQDPDIIAASLLAELEDGNPRMEVGYAGRRYGVNLRRAPFSEDHRAVKKVVPGEVYIFSGGGRGVVFECAHALARLGAIAVVCGRTPQPAGGAPWLQLDDEQFAAYRQQEMLRHKRENPTMTPVRFASEFDVVARQREVHRNFLGLDGLPLYYYPCDITDPAQVHALFGQVRTELGPIHGIVHGAMVEWSRSLPSKTPAIVDATMATKATGLCNLMAAAHDEPLHTVMCFGSGAGRFGNRGQSDYCAANSQMAALLPVLCQDHPRKPRSVTLDWTAWQDVGAAVANADVKSLVKATGVTAIRPQEGIYWFLGELALGMDQEVVIFEERMLHDWPFLGSNGEGVAFDDRGAVLVPGEWPLVDHAVECGGGSIRFERRLDVERDTFLSQHRLHGTPIVPATFGCEILAEAAALSCPGWQLVSASDIVIDVPVKLHREAPLLIRVSANVVEDDGDTRVVAARTVSHLFLHGKALQEDRRHHSGRFALKRGAPAPPRTLHIPEAPGIAHARSFFHLAKDPVALGPLFCRAEWLQVRGNIVTGTVRAPRQRDIMSRTTFPIFQVDPLLMDAAFQVAANWDGYLNGHVSIPMSVAGLTLGRRRQRDESARVRAVMIRVVDADVYYDIEVAGERDELLMEIRGLQLRRIAQLAGLKQP
jgi:acyl transferase domain-containing protein/NAD(P)-dependent dehydrogenase (short-subunit alcohol dehydrogenase family)